MEIKQVRKFKASEFRDFNKLLLQLSSSGRQIKSKQFRDLMKDKNILLFGLYDHDRIIGTASLVMVRVISGAKLRLEDVVVDEQYRGKGLGEMLMRAVIVAAKKMKVEKIEFTSRPERVAANKLYQKLGFTLKGTNSYQMKF